MPEVAADARLLIYSLVNTVCAMESLEVQSVQLLVEGQRVPDYSSVNAAVPLSRTLPWRSRRAPLDIAGKPYS